MSGTLPASTRVEIVASNCFELSYWMSMPVASSNALTFSLNLTSSPPAKAPKAVTVVPLNLPAKASASSYGMSAAPALSPPKRGEGAGGERCQSSHGIPPILPGRHVTASGLITGNHTDSGNVIKRERSMTVNALFWAGRTRHRYGNDQPARLTLPSGRDDASLLERRHDNNSNSGRAGGRIGHDRLAGLQPARHRRQGTRAKVLSAAEDSISYLTSARERCASGDPGRRPSHRRHGGDALLGRHHAEHRGGARQAGLSLLIGNSRGPAGDAILRSFQASRVEGIVFAATFHREVEPFEARAVPGVLVNCFATPHWPRSSPMKRRRPRGRRASARPAIAASPI